MASPNARERDKRRRVSCRNSMSPKWLLNVRKWHISNEGATFVAPQHPNQLGDQGAKRMSPYSGVEA